MMIVFSVTSCQSYRKVVKEPLKEYGADYLFKKLKENELRWEWFSAQFAADIIIDKKKNSFSGQIRMKRDSALWISFSPALGIEMMRLLLTNDSVRFINRINNTYFTGSSENINAMLDANIDYDVIQSILLGNDLTYYEEGRFRATYDSREYHLVTTGRAKLKKYVKTLQDEERIYIQNIFMDPLSFKITQMKIKEVKRENKKLDAFYSDFREIGGQLFPHRIFYDLVADIPVQVSIEYTRITLDTPHRFIFRIPEKYTRIQ
ncbi:MAG: DUF4292 domain-containing protein [Bacteroidales bacterium]|nr:DUF4292 domain-containing protein [Bacteroidales bacterium]